MSLEVLKIINKTTAEAITISKSAINGNAPTIARHLSEIKGKTIHPQTARRKFAEQNDGATRTILIPETSQLISATFFADKKEAGNVFSLFRRQERRLRNLQLTPKRTAFELSLELQILYVELTRLIGNGQKETAQELMIKIQTLTDQLNDIIRGEDQFPAMF